MTRSIVSKRRRRRMRGTVRPEPGSGPEALAILEDLIHPPRNDRHITPDMPAWPLAEHSRVLAVQEITERGIAIPKGAVGTIVRVVRDGLGYDVEFTTPLHAVVAATREELRPILSENDKRA